MPVRNKALSEYKKKFRWHESVKSSSFQPSPEQKSPFAGLSSADLGQQEPSLQRKRYPLPTDDKVTYTTKQFFGDVSGADGDVGKRKVGGASSMGLKPLKTYKVGGSGETGAAAHKARASKEPVKHKTQLSPGLRPANGKAGFEEKKLPGNKSSNANNNHQDVTSNGKKDGRENAPYNTKPAHKHTTKPSVALQYQAGIKDLRPKSAKYLSEYQRNFEWRKALPKESPLMAAEQMVYKSQANVAPFIPDKIPRQSEYKVQFKDWSPTKQRPASSQQQLMDNAEREIKAKYRLRTKSKKSKRGSLTPDKMRPAGVPSVYAHDDLKLLKSAENPTKPFFPHSSTIRKWRSEYASNFKEPDIFRYENGVWKGVDPPHITPKDDSSVDRQPRQETTSARPSWFSEVLELRQKAEDYRKRAQGTHFSREHLAQILASQARLWDESSTATSTVSSLSAPSVDDGAQDGSKQDIRPAPVVRSQGSPPVRRRLAWPQKTSKDVQVRPAQGVRNGEPQPLDDGDQESSIGSIPTPEGYKGSATPSSDEVETIDEQGRLPTPRLREEGLTKRHHLDRTTPATGGAILTSPQPKRRSPPPTAPAPVASKTLPAAAQTTAMDHHRNIIPGRITRGFAYDSDEDMDDEHSLTPRVTTPPPRPDMEARLQGSPSAGLTTRDPDPLRETALPPPPFRRHSNTYFETSPSLPILPRKIEPPRTWAAPRETGAQDAVANGLRPAASLPNRQGTRQAPGVRGPLDRPNSANLHGRPMTAHPQTRQEAGSSATAPVPSQSPPDDRAAPGQKNEAWTIPATPPGNAVARDSDELSLSTMSIASNSSLASEVLERARRRRDDFWGK